MTNYELDIMELLPGVTPKAKYENLAVMIDVLTKIITPRRGSAEENWDTYDAMLYAEKRGLILPE